MNPKPLFYFCNPKKPFFTRKKNFFGQNFNQNDFKARPSHWSPNLEAICFCQKLHLKKAAVLLSHRRQIIKHIIKIHLKNHRQGKRKN
jgi:hypothetical protein